MKKSKLLLTLLMAGLMATSVAGLTACGGADDGGNDDNGGTNTEQPGGDETPDDGGNETPDDGGSETPDDGGNETPDDGGSETPDDGGSETPDDGGSETPDDGGSETPDDGGNETPDDGGNETPDDGGDPNVDETAPVITVAGNPQSLTVELNQPLTIPTATAVDDVDGEVTVESFCETTTGALVDGVFQTDVLGEHLLTYYAFDAADNETYVDIVITVTSDTYAETADVTGHNGLTILDGEGTFKENFEKGWQSPLIQKAVLNEAVVKAGEQSINGNSLVIDYTQCVAKENRVFLNTVPIRDGIWTLSFDVKLISGVADSDFYVGYVKEGEVDSKDQQFPLNDMKVGDVKRIEYKQLLNLDENGQYYFHFFEYMRDMQAVLAFDNFEITYEAAPSYTEVVPTLDQAKAGFTYDWANNYMSVTSGMPEEVSKIENADAKAAIEGATSGFGTSVMHLTGNGAHDLSALDKTLNADLFQKGWVYTFEIDYYAVSLGSHYMLAYDGTSGNNAFKANPFSVGLGKATIEYTVGANDNKLTFYGDMDVYLGNFKLTMAEPVETREDFHTVTNAEMMADGGYTFDWSANNIVEISSNSKYLEISKMEDTTLAAALTATDAFANGYAMKFSGTSSSYINCLNGLLVAGNKYTVSFDAYQVVAGSVAVLLMDADGAQLGGAVSFVLEDNGNGTTKYTATFTATAETAQVNLYILTECELYLANLTLIEKEPSASVVEHTYSGTKVWSDLNGGSKGTQVATPEAVKGNDGFADDYTLQMTSDYATSEMFQVGSLIPSGETFKSLTLTVHYYVVEGFSGRICLQIDSAAFPDMETSAGYHTFTYTLENSADWICIHMPSGTSGSMYMGSIDWTLITTAEA